MSIDTFSKIKRLNRLILEHNQINSLKNIINGLSNNSFIFLKYLDLSYNRIKEISNTFGTNFRLLETLDLNSNEIEFMSDNAFENLFELKFLHLGGN